MRSRKTTAHLYALDTCRGNSADTIARKQSRGRDTCLYTSAPIAVASIVRSDNIREQSLVSSLARVPVRANSVIPGPNTRGNQGIPDTTLQSYNCRYIANLPPIPQHCSNFASVETDPLTRSMQYIQLSI